MAYDIIIPKSAIKDTLLFKNLIKNFDQNSVFTLRDKKELALRINTKLKDNIDNSVDLFGRPFKPLSEKTYNRKKPNRGGPDAVPLKDTGILYEGMKFEVIDNIIRLMNNVPYVIYHQEGTKTIPKRQIYPENGILGRPLQELISDFVEKRVKSNIDKMR